MARWSTEVDLIQVLADCQFEQSHWGATWNEGDFDGDGYASSLDLILALAGGQYEQAAAVPEPGTFTLVFLLLIMITMRRSCA